MPIGTPVNRNWVLVLKEGSIVIDWGDGWYQDVRSGDFVIAGESTVSTVITDELLDWLKRIGRVSEYDSRQVYFFNLPERPQGTID
jgi:hypothetical protein